MKAIRWLPHAEQNLADREIDRSEAEATIAGPEYIVPGQVGRKVYMRRYHDSLLGQDMLMRVVMEETGEERSNNMRVTYDEQSDSMTITFRRERIRESDEIRPGVIADFGYDGGLVRIEVTNASKVVENTKEMQFAMGT